MGALDGLLVADFTRVLAGPYATMLFADLGATVIKVERPGVGDDSREWGPPYADDGQSTYFHAVNRNKSSVTLDFSSPDDVELARRLCERADVVIHNFRSGVMERHGLAYDDLQGTNPGLVYAVVSGFGHEAGAALPGYDLLVQAEGGLMDLTGPPGQPSKVGVALVDVLAGLHIAVGVLAALQARAGNGRGQQVHVTLLGSLLSALVNQSSAYLAGGVVPHSLGNAHPSVAPYEPLRAADRPLVVAVGNDAQFERLCAAIGRSDLVGDARFATNPQRVLHREDLRTQLEAQFIQQPAAHWQRMLTEVGVPCGPINDLAGAFAFAEELGLGTVADLDGIHTAANPLGMSETPPNYRRASPVLGADDDAVRRWLASDAGPPPRLEG